MATSEALALSLVARRTQLIFRLREQPRFFATMGNVAYPAILERWGMCHGSGKLVRIVTRETEFPFGRLEHAFIVGTMGSVAAGAILDPRVEILRRQAQSVCIVAVVAQVGLVLLQSQRADEPV
jgi:hypothetical protein